MSKNYKESVIVLNPISELDLIRSVSNESRTMFYEPSDVFVKNRS
jgi:hypothetical protein